MRRVTNLICAVVTGVILPGTIGGCGKIRQTDQTEVGKVRADVKRQKAACASSGVYARLKSLMFDQAVLQHEGSRANLDTLADYTVARMEDPVVQAWDPALDVTRCGGRFILEIPPSGLIGTDESGSGFPCSTSRATFGHAQRYQHRRLGFRQGSA